MRIRHARADDIPALQDLERRAGEMFRELGMDAVADDPPLEHDDLVSFVRDHRAWVATDEHDQPIGYLLVRAIDGAAHVEQVSLDPLFSHRGIGSRLIDEAATWAARKGLSTLTLTTFSAVPWNAPYYRRLGFRRIPERALSPELRKIRQAERARGLDRWPRATMGRDVLRHDT